MEKEREMRRGLMLRVILSIITLSAFLIGSLIYVGFYTDGFSLGQRIIVVLVAIILAITALSVMWVTWAGRRGMMGWWRDWPRNE
jgi:uncharacterized membrane protein